MENIRTEQSTQACVSRNAAFLVILGGLMAMLGIIAMASPLAAGLAVELVIGLMVLSRGTMQMYYGFKVRHWGKTVGSYMGLGAIAMSFVSVACGVLLLAYPFAGVSFLTLLLASYLVIGGIFDMLHAFELRSAEGWYWVLLGGLASLVLGAMIAMQWPLSGAWAAGLLVGASLIVGGISLAGLGLSGRQYLIKRKAPPLTAQQA